MTKSSIAIGVVNVSAPIERGLVSAGLPFGIDLRQLGGSTLQNNVSWDENSQSSDIRLVVLQQDHRGRYSKLQLASLRRQFPLALLACIDGRWNYGVTRSGKPYAGVIHVREPEAVPRICRILECMNSTPPVFATYHPLFSARESLNWWLKVGVQLTPQDRQHLIEVYGHRDAAYGVVHAFEHYGIQSTRLPLNALESNQRHESCLRRVALVQNRAEVRQLVASGALHGIDVLVADNVTAKEREYIGVQFGCRVLEKLFQNDDLVRLLVRMENPSMARAA